MFSLRNVTLICCIGLFTLIAFSGNAFCTTYYVRTDGNDGNTGLGDSPSESFQTIQRAADILQPGDTVIVTEGTYFEEVVPANSGIENHPITYKAKDGDTVILGGGRVAFNAYRDPVIIDYLIIDGFHIKIKKYSTAIQVGNNNIIRSNKVEADYGVFTYGVFIGGSNNLITDNHISNCRHGVTHEDQIFDNIVSNNIIEDNVLGLKITDGSIKVIGNIITGSTEAGIFLNSYVYNISIINNTLFSNNVDIFLSPHHGNISIKNNIMADSQSSALEVQNLGSATLTSDYNDFFNDEENLISYLGTVYTANTFTEYQESTNLDYNSITDNPLFVNAVGNNYHLQPGSPCRDAGDPAPIYNDLDGTRNDMGAYGGPTPIGPKIPILSSPKNNNYIKSDTPTFIWKNSTNIVGDTLTYQIIIDNNLDFSSPERNISGIVEGEVVITSYTMASPLSNDRYYWKVRSNDGYFSSGWSIVWSFTVDTISPVISAVCISPDTFSPNYDNIKDSTTISYSLSEEATTTIGIYDFSDNLVRTIDPSFFDDFDDGNDFGWDATPKGPAIFDGREYGLWSVEVGEYNCDLPGAAIGPSYGRAITGDASWTDYVFESKVRFINGHETQVWLNTDFLFRYQDENNYYKFGVYGYFDIYYKPLALTTMADIGLFKVVNGVTTRLSPSGQQFEIIKDTWYKTKIIADGSNIKVVFGRDVENGPVQIVSVDDFSLTNGKIGFGGSCDESGVHNHFDDVKVYKVGDTWTWNGKDDLGNLVSDGIYTYKIDATDFAGNPAVQQTGTITLDATYPDSVVTAPVDGTSYSTLPAIFGTAFDETSGLSDVQISIQNITGNTFWDGTVSNWVPTETWINMGALADWSYTAPAWSDGSNYRVRAKTVDNAGNVETPSSGNRFAFILSPDADSPVVNVLFPEEGDYFLAENPVINIAGVLDDAHLKSYVIEYSAGAAPLSWTKIYRSSGIPLNAATYDELVGIEGVGPATAQEIINARPFYNWQDVLDVKYVGIVRLKSIQNSCILPVSQEGLIYQWDTTDVPKGNYTIRITGEDMSGNSTEMEVNINIKTLPPAISTGEVVINEIAWSGTKGGGWSDEWIELFNNTSSTIYLTGCSLYDSDGKMDIDFIGNIPPGEYLTGYFLIENDEECTTEPSDIADPSVSLNNTGEQLILYDCHGNLIDTANGTGAWFAGDNTDFHRTMERRNPTFPGTIARNWASNDGLTKNGTDKSGYALYGTPKAENSVYDVTPPEAVTTLTATAKAAGDIELSWLEPFDNLSGVYEYKIFRSTYPGTGSEITLSTNTLYTDSGANLEDKVRYYYTVQPVDVPGNVQTVDNNQSSAVCDKIPPVFTVICSPVKAKTNDVVTIKVFSNETLITDPGVTALDNFSNSIFLSGPVVSTNTWTYTTVIDTTMAEGAAIVNVSGTDLVGNQGAGQGWLNIDNIPDIQNVSDSPDPCRTAVELSTVTYELTTDAAVSINLLDANNNIVRHLVSELSELTGVRSHAWDGKDDSGNWLPNGIYTYQIKTNVGGSITTDESAEVTISNVLVVITVPVFYVDGVANNVFSPDDDGLADTIDIVYSLSEEAGVSVIISDKVTGEIVRNLITDETRAVGISTDTWDGKRDSGFYVPNASYNIKIIAETYGNPVESAPGLVIVKSKDILVFSDIADSPDPFSPDGDFVDEVSTITYSLSDLKGATSSYVSIKIYSDSGGENLVRDLISNSEEAVPGIYSHTWDGKREDGKFVSNGKYYYQLTGTDQFGYTTEVGPSQQYIITMQVDVLTISVEPVNPATFSPDGDGTDDITTLSYMFSDTKTTEPVKVSVKVYSDQEGTSITRCLLSDTTQALDVLQNVVWDGKDDNRGLVSPGDYYYQVTAFDVLGYSCESSMNKVTISNTALYVYNISTEPDPFSPNFDGVRDTITIHYSISKNSNVTIRIEDKDNPDIFRILIDDELRQSGQNPQSADWGGRDYNGDIVSDGIYLLNIQAKTAQKTSPVESSYIVVASESPNETMSSDGFVDIWYPNIAGAVSISTTSVPDNASKSLQLSGLEIMGELYDISPDGVIFTPAAFLIMFYEPALLPEGGSEEELDIYDWNEELGEWVALGGTVDRINHRVIVRVGSVASLYAVLSPVSTMFDTTPPEFGVVLTVDPETSDEMIITVTASEELQAAPDIIAEVLPNGNSKKDKKQSVEIEMEPVTGTTTTYKGIYTKRTGFGDIDKIYVTGKDLAGNEGVSDGSFVREVVSSVKVSRAGPDMTFRKGEIYSYPNPAKRGKKPTIHVECGIADKVQIKIYNIAGELVYTKELSGNEFTIVRGKYAYEHAWNISDIASGVYLYSVKALKEGEGDITEVKKLAVIK